MKKRKTIKKSVYTRRSVYTIVIILYLIICSFFVGYLFGEHKQQNVTYKFCRSFNFMAYLNTENMRHYQDPTFELSQMPNCEVFKGSGRATLTYDEWLSQNNLKHLEFNKTKS